MNCFNCLKLRHFIWAQRTVHLSIHFETKLNQFHFMIIVLLLYFLFALSIYIFCVCIIFTMESNRMEHGKMPVSALMATQKFMNSNFFFTLFLFLFLILSYAISKWSHLAMGINFILNGWSKFQTQNRLYFPNQKNEQSEFSFVRSLFTFFLFVPILFLSFLLTIYDFVNLCICSCKMEMKAICVRVCLCFWYVYVCITVFSWVVYR